MFLAESHTRPIVWAADEAIYIWFSTGSELFLRRRRSILHRLPQPLFETLQEAVFEGSSSLSLNSLSALINAPTVYLRRSPSLLSSTTCTGAPHLLPVLTASRARARLSRVVHLPNHLLVDSRLAFHLGQCGVHKILVPVHYPTFLARRFSNSLRRSSTRFSRTHPQRPSCVPPAIRQSLLSAARSPTRSPRKTKSRKAQNTIDGYVFFSYNMFLHCAFFGRVVTVGSFPVLLTSPPSDERNSSRQSEDSTNSRSSLRFILPSDLQYARYASGQWDD